MKALLINSRKPTDMRVYADSVLARSGYPLFVPDEPGPWSGTVNPALRIGRLGKCIQPKFAMRYVESLTAVHLLHSPAAGAIAQIVDGAIIHGDEIPADQAGNELTISVTDAEGRRSRTISIDELNIPDALASLSRLSTFKTGDMVIFTDFAIPTDLNINQNQYIEAAINGRTCLKFKVK